MYTITPDQSLAAWAIEHGWCAQRCDASVRGELKIERPLRGQPQTKTATSSSQSVRNAPAPSEIQISRHDKSVLVVYESHHDRGGGVVEAIAESARSHGFSALIRTIDEVSPDEVLSSDALISGCWMPGRAPLSNDSTKRMLDWVEGLPPLPGKPVGLFCTYRFFPYTFADMASRTAALERELTARFESKGVKIAAKKSIHFKSIEEEAAKLVESVLRHVHSDDETVPTLDRRDRTA